MMNHTEHTKNTIKLDETDLAILKAIQAEARISNNELAKRINLSQPAAHSRLKRLIGAGIIQGFEARLDFEKLGFELHCFFQTRMGNHAEQEIEYFESQVASFPQILECHYITGEFDHLLKGVFKSRQDLEQFLRTQLSTIPGVANITTSLVLSEIKAGSTLPDIH